MGDRMRKRPSARLRAVIQVLLWGIGAHVAGAETVSSPTPTAPERPDSVSFPSVVGSVRFAGQTPFDSDSIANRAADHWRWLTIPNSRLVLNPAMPNTFVDPPDGPDAPLHVGCYVGKEPVRLLNLLALTVRPVAPASTTAPAEDYQSAWYPYQLTFRIDCPQSGVSLAGRDFFHDENTIIRLVDVETAAGAAALPAVIEATGTSQGDVRPSPAGEPFSLICFGRKDLHCVIAAVRLVGSEGTPAPLSVSPAVADGKWSLRIPITADTRRLAFVIAFATGAEGANTAVERVRAACRGDGLVRSLARRKAAWNAWLSKVPAPEKFDIEAVDPRGVTPEQHRRFYYGAWAFVISNVLPPMPENHYPHAQTPAGKPSLWNFGASRATASAAWESFFAQQLLAYVMPDTAWDAFEGIMMQVDEKGWLDGECLPSRKAQTAWILYSLTGDRERLARVYPPIRRYLLWREQNPRWIHHGHDIADEKDSSFVDHLLVDMDFAARIAGALGNASDVEMWNGRRPAILANYRKWFFPAGGPPMENYFTASGKRNPGNPNWIASGLHIPGLPDDLVEALKRFYLGTHKPEAIFCGVSWTKYATDAFIVYGLFEHGESKPARELANALLRDEILAGEFAEQYERRKPPKPPVVAGGVRPSMFGAAQMIDFTCLNNGVRLDQGLPRPLAFQTRP